MEGRSDYSLERSRLYAAAAAAGLPPGYASSLLSPAAAATMDPASAQPSTAAPYPSPRDSTRGSGVLGSPPSAAGGGSGSSGGGGSAAAAAAALAAAAAQAQAQYEERYMAAVYASMAHQAGKLIITNAVYHLPFKVLTFLFTVIIYQ